MPASPKASSTAPLLSVPGFGLVEPERVVAENDSFLVVTDKYPISPGHTLIMARRPVIRFADLTVEERASLLHWIDWTVHHLQKTLRPPPDGFNIGTNDGTAAGQTIPQLHWHVIPRYTGDVSDPRGGVRFVIPEKARYW
jgi:diadenosine tetraphosphate (Ap4A) HIT family hydrolase